MDSHRAKTAPQRRTGRPVGPRPDPMRIAVVRQRLYDEGKTITSWATEHGETLAQVSKVLSGKRACVSGDSHRIAVKLGIKDAVAGSGQR